MCVWLQCGALKAFSFSTLKGENFRFRNENSGYPSDLMPGPVVFIFYVAAFKHNALPSGAGTWML